MEEKVEKLGKGKNKLTITVPAEKMAGYFARSLEKLSQNVKIAGFRPGKAPRMILEENIGKARILAEALDLAVSETYFEAITKEKIAPISSPNVSISKYPNYGQGEEVTEGMVYEAEVESMPEIELADYSNLKLDKIEKKAPSKEDVSKVLGYFQKQRAAFNNVDRPAKKGDRVEINFEGTLKKVRIDQMCSKNHPLVVGEGNMIPGFEDQIVGMKKGEKKTFKIKFPKDYHAKEYAGKEAEFEIELLDIKEIKLPDLDNEFAKGFGHDTISQLEKAVEANIAKEMEMEYQNAVESQAIEKVLPLLKAEVPESLVARETDRMVGDMEKQLQAQGISMDVYLKGIKKDIAELKQGFEKQAEKNVKIGLLLSKLIDDLGLDRNKPESAKKAVEHLISKMKS